VVTALVGVVALLWALVLVLLVGTLVAEALTGGDATCRVPGLPEAQGEASWQWWPPGSVCRLGDETFDEPPTLRGWAVLAEVVVGLGLVVLWRQGRDRPDPDWRA